MRLPTRSAPLAMLLVLALAVTVLPGTGFADDDNDNKRQNDNQETRRQTTAKPSGTPQPTSPAGARPDLSITVDGLEPPNVEHTLRFKVTNIGKARSTGIKARILTVSGGPTNVSEPEVPPLAPGESALLYYGIGSCDGQVIRATVNDPLDFPSANDRAEKVCPAKPKPGGGVSPSDRVVDASTPSLPSSVIDQIQEGPVPEYLRLGQHTLDFPASKRRWHGVHRWQADVSGQLCLTPNVPDDARVGFVFSDGAGCGEYNVVHQYITDVDLQWLRSIEKKLVVRAELLYEERIVVAWKDGRDVLAESIAAGRTCIGRAGVAPNDVETRLQNKELIPTENVVGDRVESGWDVTREIQLWMVPQSDWNGLVLHGWDENLGARIIESCMSDVDNVRLRLTYVLL